MDSWHRSEPGRRWSRRRVIGAGVGLGAGLALSGALGTTSAWADPAEFDADVGLDAGHSRFDVGASGAGVGEYQHTLDVAQRIKPLLEEAGLRVNLEPDRSRAALGDGPHQRRRADPHRAVGPDRGGGEGPDLRLDPLQRRPAIAARHRDLLQQRERRPGEPPAGGVAPALRRRRPRRVRLRHRRSRREGRPAGRQAVRALLQPARRDAQRAGRGAVPLQPDRGTAPAPGRPAAGPRPRIRQRDPRRTSPAADGPRRVRVAPPLRAGEGLGDEV